MVCDYCQSDFELNGSRGGQNRRFCYECFPAGLGRRERNLVRNQLLAAMSSRYKKSLGCSRCGYDRCCRALEWHHPEDDKVNDPSNALNVSWEAYLTETQRCILLCANCHREEHFGV